MSIPIKRSALMAALLLVMGHAGAAAPNETDLYEVDSARSVRHPYSSSPIDLSIVDRQTGHTLKKYVHNGQFYVAGRPGAKYAIRLNNQDRGRVLTVVSVDGINVLSGEKASFDDTGYVLSYSGSTEITGWRKSDHEVAAFEFTALSSSYAARTGKAENVGVIGVAAFTEKYRARLSRHKSRSIGSASDSAGESSLVPSAPGVSAMSKSESRAESLGTGHGEREQSDIVRTNFERDSSTPNQVLTIRYDSYDNLVAAGVIPRPRHAPPKHVTPQAFPGSNGYVPDPPR